MSAAPRAAALLVLALLAALPRDAGADTHACVEAAHEGQRLRDAGALVGARDAFVTCSVSTCPAVVRESCERWIGEIELRLPSVVLGARDAAGRDLVDVRVSLDGKELTRRLDGRSLSVDPGPHELVFEASGLAPVRQSVVAREGEKFRAVLATFAPAPAAVGTASASPDAEPRAPAAPARRVAPLLVAGGAAVLGLAGFAILGRWGQDERERLEATCAAARTCAADDVSAARTKLLLADVSLVVGIAGAGVLAALLVAPLLHREPAPPKRALSLAGVPVRGGFVGSLEYRY